MPNLKRHLERYKSVLTASKENCYHNEMLRKIMEPIVVRGNYFTVFYPRPKTNFEAEKIVFVCDTAGTSITYSNLPFYASGGNKGGLSFITRTTSDGPSLKLLFGLFISKKYSDYLKFKDVETFLSNETIKKFPIDLISANQKDIYLSAIEGTYTLSAKKGYAFDKSTSTYVQTKGLVDFFTKCVLETRLKNMRFKSQAEADRYLTSNLKNLSSKLETEIKTFGAEDIKLLINGCLELSKLAQLKMPALKSSSHTSSKKVASK